jgi:hypothetical protein
VRFCAAPGASATGLLLDLLPGLVGRQVVVIPADGAPAPHSIARAIARYRPDNITLTARQAAMLVVSPLDEDASRALAGARVVVADVNPVPMALRTALAARCQRLDVVYVMPEVSDVHVVVREPRDAVR